jgi:hypothetical protein
VAPAGLADAGDALWAAKGAGVHDINRAATPIHFRLIRSIESFSSHPRNRRPDRERRRLRLFSRNVSARFGYTT